MTSFFTNLIDKITSVFKSKDLDDNITNFQGKVDTIINDLLLPYTNPDKKLGSNERFSDMLNLLDPTKCNKIAMTFASNLDKNYTKIQMEQFSNSILVGKEIKNCEGENCENNEVKDIMTKNGDISKREMCNSVAVHYVKILNLIVAVLTAVNPTDNICLNRLRNLLTIINEDEKTGVSEICNTTNGTVKDSIMNEPGFKELVMLYYYHLIQDVETDAEKENVRNQYKYLLQTFSNMVMVVDPKLKTMDESKKTKSNKNKTLNSNLELNNLNTMSLNNLEKSNKLNKNINNQSQKSKTIVSENTIDKLKSNISNNIKAVVKEKLNNIDTKQTEKFDEYNTKLQSQTNKLNSIKDNLSQFKEEDGDKLNNIVSKIDALSSIIKTLQNSNTNLNPELKSNITAVSTNNINKKSNNNNTLTNVVSKQLNEKNNTQFTNNTITNKVNTNKINTKINSNQLNSNQLNSNQMNSKQMNSNQMKTNSSVNSSSVNSTTEPTMMEPTMEPTAKLTMADPTTAEPTTAEPMTAEPTTAEPTMEPMTADSTTTKPTTPNTPNLKSILNNYQSGGTNNNNNNNNNNKKKNKKKNNNNNNSNSNYIDINNNNNINNINNNNNNNNNKNNKNKKNKKNTINNINNYNNNNNNSNNNQELEIINLNNNEEPKTIKNTNYNINNSNNSNNMNNTTMNNNMNNTTMNNNTNNTTMNNTMNNTIMNNTTQTTLLKQFANFVKNYTLIDKIDDNLMKIVNTGFKTYDKFSEDIPAENALYLNNDNFEDFCINKANTQGLLSVTLDDPRLTDYIKIYKDMKNMYIDNCEYLLNLLEREVLVKTSSETTTSETETPHFTIKNIGYSELVEVETDIRNRLVTMYSSCHEQYQKGMVSLYTALKTETSDV